MEKYWFTTGTSGFGIYKFAFRRLEKQAPPPWTFEGVDGNNNDRDSAETEEENKEAAMMENMSVEEKLRSMIERDGLVYNPREMETESDTEDIKPDAKQTKLEESGSESNEVKDDVDEKQPDVYKEDDTDKVKSDAQEQYKNEEIEPQTEMKQSIVENEPNESKAEEYETDAEGKQVGEPGESKVLEHETETDLKADFEEDNQRKSKCRETETDTVAGAKRKSESDVDIEGDGESTSETDNDKSGSVEKSVENKSNEIQNNKNKTESDAEDICSQDSGIASQENTVTKSETPKKYETKPEPLREAGSQNSVAGDHEKVKAEKKTELKTPKGGNKIPRTKTPKSESKAPKGQEGGSKKAKSTTPKNTSKGKQLTMMDMFKPKPKS